MTTIKEIAHDTALGLILLVETPVNSKNFVVFNKTCDELDPSYLSQPVNEAEYDSETQACVDLFRHSSVGARPPGNTKFAVTKLPCSFYDHFVSKPTKKKFMRGIGLEEPIRQSECPPLQTPSVPFNNGCCSELQLKPKVNASNASTQHLHDRPVDYLSVPLEKGVPLRPCNDGGHALLDNPAIRRMATGAAPALSSSSWPS